jgi:thiol-disulfide isomerase/thioredoxin
MDLEFLRSLTPFFVTTLAGALLGAGVGYFGQCTSGTCPLTSTWWRGAIYGAVLGLVFAFTLTAESRADGRTATFQPVANNGSDAPTAPDWSLRDVNGKDVTLSSFKGKVVVLNFWATWCPPCREEIPDLIKLQKKYAEKGLVVIGMSVDEAGPAAVKAFVRRTGMNYPVVIVDEKTAFAYGITGAIPTTFVINREGKVVTGIQGGADLSTFEQMIQRAL